MNDNEETSYELERRLRTERAREKYLEQHPFHKDRVEINPVEVIVELSSEYFGNNPDRQSFIVKKGLLGAKLGVGTTKTEAVCKALEGEYNFVKNERGFIEIDRQGFDTWFGLMEEKRKQKETGQAQYEEYKQLKQQNEEREKSLKEAEAKLSGWRTSNEDLEKRIKEIQAVIDGFPAKLKDLEAKKEQVIAECKQKREEYEENQKRIEEAVAESRRKLEEDIKSRNWFFRPKLVEYEIDKSPLDKFLGELLRFLGYGILFRIMLYFFYG